jgi:hypothetical protein
MKTRTRRQHRDNYRCYEFCFPRLDTLLQVDASPEAAVIRATRDTFSEQYKVCFIHELAAEGFIDDSYRWFSGFSQGAFLPVRWLVDRGWLKLNEDAVARTQRFILRWQAGATLLWLVMMSVILISSR